MMNCYLQNAILPTIFSLKKIVVSDFINAFALVERCIALKFLHSFLFIILYLLCKESFLCGAGYLFTAPASVYPAKTRADRNLSELFSFQPPSVVGLSISSESQSALFGIHSETPESQSTIVLRVSERSERRNASPYKGSGAFEGLSTIAG